jgi:integrase
MMRNRRAGVEDLWFKTIRNEDDTTEKVPSKLNGKGSRWRARYVDGRGREHSKGFARKVDAQAWLDGQTSAIVQGTHVAPRDARVTVQQWCDRWIAGYEVNRKSTVRQARTHLKHILAEFGDVELGEISPLDVKTWQAKLKAAGFKDSYRSALHSRLNHILSDAIDDGLLGRNPCSKKTSPPAGKQKPYCATTGQVWALHDAMPEHLRVAVLLGAFAGLRVAEVSGLRVADVDFIRGIVHPKLQWPADPLKTEGSDAPIPIPHNLALLLSSSVQRWPSDMMVTNGPGTEKCGPWIIERAVRDAKVTIEGLPQEFSFHDLRHYFASLLISEKEDVKTVQARMRHASATTTLNVYGHLWPDADESTRSAVGSVIAERMDSSETTAYDLRTNRADS